MKFTNHENREELRNEGINFLWHPWAIDAAVRWLERTKRIPAPRSQVVGVQRALGWLVVDSSEKQRKDATGGMSFVAGEALDRAFGGPKIERSYSGENKRRPQPQPQRNGQESQDRRREDDADGGSTVRPIIAREDDGTMAHGMAA